MSYWDLISLLNAIAFFAISAPKRLRDKCKESRGKIRGGYPEAYWVWSQTWGCQEPSESHFKSSTDKLFRMHNAQCKIALIEHQSRTLHGLSIGLLILALLLVVSGMVVFYATLPDSPDAAAVRPTVVNWLVIYLPVVLFFCQLMIIWKTHTGDDFLDSIEEDIVGELSLGDGK